jgi:hypothetical protein
MSRNLKRLGAAMLFIVTAGVPMAMTGCGAQAGKTIMTQGANAEPIMGVAPETGEYKLYTSMSPNPTTTVNLKEGEPLGWRRTPEGQLEAVAGTQTQVLPKGTAQAYWKLQNSK